MKVNDLLISLCPASLRLPVKFYYYKLNRRLENELLQLEKLVGHGKRAIDVGANYGFYSYVLSRLFDVVEAFEPENRCFEMIKAYSQSYKNNINVHNVALANASGTLDFYTPIVRGKSYTGLSSLTKPQQDYVSTTVNVCKLDDYKFANVSFIKIDVEGHESEVIEGAQETILREKPFILVEIEQRHLEKKSIDMVFDLITSLGYEGSFLYSDKLLPLSEFTYKKYQEPFEEDLSNHKYDLNNYINNFLFKPKSVLSPAQT